MKKNAVFLLTILTLQLSLLFISCNKETVMDTVTENAITSSDSIYAIDKEQLGDWQEGYIKYLEGSESQSCYIVSTYDSDENLRTTYFGQLDKDVREGYYLFTDQENMLMELKSKDFTYIYDDIFDEGVWKVYDNDGELIKALELGKVSLKVGSTRGLMDNIVDLHSWFNNANLGFHQEWGELIQNIGTDIVLKTLKIGKWPVQLLVEGLSAVEAADRKWQLYDGCVPQIKKCESNGNVEVYINGISNLTNIYKEQEYNPLTKEYEMVEKPGKEVSMAVAIRKDESYVTYSNCDNHTTYVKISSSQGNITVSSPIKFEPGVDYYLRPYLIEKSLFNERYNTFRQRYIQYGDVYKFRYTDVEIKKIEKVFLKSFSESQYAVRLKISAHIESLSNVHYWGVTLYDKNNEQLEQLQCFSDNGKKDNDFQYDGYLDKSLFKDGTTQLKLVPYAKYDDERYAYGEAETCTLAVEGCPDSNHPHWIDLGLPSGTQWRCCNEGGSAPEAYGGYYAFGQVSSAPTKEQIQELLGCCSSEWTTLNGVNGRKFTGPNGGSIFLPAAGYRRGGEFYNVGSGGDYWSSTPYDEDLACGLGFGSYGAAWGDSYFRFDEQSVRPVR